ncbi:hypothetical protein GOP47_0023162 [Adiantum capillus-veneris]|uniref:Methyltransferase n=1 Tax=Adiantum capillus-veneris TaxID=13818 RepID=A0A9D4U6Z5_ADICA|nr:hypothetical protein GOP47_0023162 [Adiantum capillus-veneris]
MALSRHFRGERKVSWHFWVIGAVLGCFLLSFWLLSPSSEVVQEEATLSLEENSSKTVHDNTKTDEEVADVLKKEHSEPEDTHKNLDQDSPKDEDSAANEDLELQRKNGPGLGKDAKSDDTEPTEEKDLFKESWDKHKENGTATATGDSNENLPLTTAAESELSMENQEKSRNWSTQIIESKEEIALNTEGENDETDTAPTVNASQTEPSRKDNGGVASYKWKICNRDSAMDYIPCLDNKEAIKRLPSRRRFQHRERHCPDADQFPMCLVPLPKGFKVPIRWPRSRHEVWLDNTPHTKLVSYKKDQNWVKLEGDKLVFPGGGTQFKYGASQYIDSVEQYVADVSWGKHTRLALDIGCGVASFGGFLFDREVLTMSFAPKDEHEAQIQLALERGIPAILAVMGTQRLPFPSNAFDLAHCARCRIHWHGDGGKWLLEVNRILRPGGYFVWSATPVYRKHPEDVDFWKAMVDLTNAMCWNLTSITKDLSSGVGFAIYQKPMTNSCYESRPIDQPPLCNEDENPDAAWYTPLDGCLHRVPSNVDTHGATWPAPWPDRLDSTPKWLHNSQKSLFGQPAATEFEKDTEHWRRVVAKSYLTGCGIDWGGIRNVMDLRAGYGGFAAALLRVPVWVMNIVPIDEPDTLPVIFDRGLLGIYHDWCESFSTYPRTYDLLHVDHLFKQLVTRCKPVLPLLEMDRILRPQGWVIFREMSSTINEILPIIETLHWDVRLSYIEGGEQLLVLRKSFWRPDSLEEGTQ